VPSKRPKARPKWPKLLPQISCVIYAGGMRNILRQLRQSRVHSQTTPLPPEDLAKTPGASLPARHDDDFDIMPAGNSPQEMPMITTKLVGIDHDGIGGGHQDL